MMQTNRAFCIKLYMCGSYSCTVIAVLSSAPWNTLQSLNDHKHHDFAKMDANPP